MVWLGSTPLGQRGSADPLDAHGFSPELGTEPISTPRLAVVTNAGEVLAKSDRLLEDLQARATLNGISWLHTIWMVAVGHSHDADRHPIFTPILRTRAELVHGSAVRRLLPGIDPVWRLQRVSDWEFAVPFDDATNEQQLLDDLVWGGMIGYPIAGDALLASSTKLRAWIRRVCEAQRWKLHSITGRHPSEVVGATAPESTSLPSTEFTGEVTICVGFGILPTHQRSTVGISASLERWATRELVENTAFAALMSPSSTDGSLRGADRTDEPLDVHVPLSQAQRRVVLSSRYAPVTVVSGAPGTGKTHLITAICADVVARGESVLIATRSLEASAVIAACSADSQARMHFASARPTRSNRHSMRSNDG